MPLNRFEVLRSKVMNIGKESGSEIKKNRKMILREEREKKEMSVEVKKIGVESSNNSIVKKEKLLREVIVKIKLKQEEDEEEEIVVKVLLNSGITGLVISSKFVKKNKFKKKLERLIYVGNMDGIFNYEG